MGQRLTAGQTKVVQTAIAEYRRGKAKEYERKAKKGLDAKEVQAYERLLSLIDNTVVAFDGDVTSVYVNR